MFKMTWLGVQNGSHLESDEFGCRYGIGRVATNDAFPPSHSTFSFNNQTSCKVDLIWPFDMQICRKLTHNKKFSVQVRSAQADLDRYNPL